MVDAKTEDKEDVRKKVRPIWDKVWAGGITNSLTAIEQLSYLIFLKRLEQQDKRLREEATAAGAKPPASHFDGFEQCRWSHLHGLQLESERLEKEAVQLRRDAKQLQTAAQRLIADGKTLLTDAQNLEAEVQKLAAVVTQLEADSNQLHVESKTAEATAVQLELDGKRKERDKKQKQAEAKRQKAGEKQAEAKAKEQQARDNQAQAVKNDKLAVERLEEAFNLMAGKVFDFLKGLDAGKPYQDAMTNAVFLIQTSTLLKSVMTDLDTLLSQNMNLDLQGDVYEELLKQLSTSGLNGQFRTPRHIIQALVALARPQFGETISDPAAGTAGFLVEAYKFVVAKYIKPPSDEMPPPADGLLEQSAAAQLSPAQRKELREGHNLIGYDIDATMVRLGLFNLLLHGVTQPQFHYVDTLSDRFDNLFPEASYDLILANPPFSGRIDKERRYRSRAIARAETDASELLFVERCLTLLRQNADKQGRCAMIVPEGVLFGSSGEHLGLRRRLLEENQLNAVISLPSGAFLPYTAVKTAILFFHRGNPTSTEQQTSVVWFYEVTGTGFSLTARQQPEPDKDNLKDMADEYYRWVEQGRPEGEFIPKVAWTASYQTIAAQNYNLSGSRYRPAQQIDSGTKVNPRVLLQQVLAKEAQLDTDLTNLDRLMQQAGISLTTERSNA